MALIILGQTACALCGKLLREGEAITGLPAISNTEHLLYKYFDQGFHLECFEKWDKKENAQDLIKAEKQKFIDSDYYKQMVSKYGKPKGLDEQG